MEEPGRMITEWDDLLIHQIISSMDHVESSDPRWHDRHWFHLGDIEGEVLLGVGMGLYPNRDVMDGFSVATVDGSQHNVLVSRRLGRDRYTAVGPLRVDVLQGLRRIRVALEPNEHDVAFDLTFESTTPPFEEQTHFNRHKGRVVRNNARYNQAGRWSGTLTVAGRKWQVEAERFWGVRDRSWGLRPGQGESPGKFSHEERHELLRHSPFGLYHYNPTQFPGYSLFYMINESPSGEIVALDGGLRFPWGSERENDVVRVTGVEHEMEFVSGTPRFSNARIELRLEDGRTKRYSVKPILPCYLAQGGGYGDPDRWHGSYRGELVVEGDRFDLTDEKVLAKLVYANDYFSEWRCDDGEVGYGQYEYLLGASERLRSEPSEPSGRGR
jgi:hypothetical protein